MSGEISRPRRSAPRDLNPGGVPLRDEWVETRVGADEVLRGGERRRDVLTFSVADEEYALGIESIREIIKCRPVTEVPRVPVFVAGIIAVRGVVMPVIDLRVRLRLPAAALSAKARILVVTRPGEAREPESREPHGLIVDRVHQVVRLGENDIEPATMLSGAEAEFIAGIGRLPLDGGADLRAARRGDKARRMEPAALPPRRLPGPESVAGAGPVAPAISAAAGAQRRMLILLDLQRVLTFDLHLSAELHEGRSQSGAPSGMSLASGRSLSGGPHSSLEPSRARSGSRDREHGR